MLIVAAAAIAVLGVAALLSAFRALVGGRVLAFVLRAAFGIAVTAAGGAGLVVAAGLEGVRALTHEEVAATIRLRPTGPQSVDATVTLADGRSQSYAIAGDEVYVDAHILKWSPRLNVLGLHTSYRLDRIGGRYRSLAQEATARRTIYALMPAAAIDLVALRQRMPLPMAPLLDAEYGSATFVPFDAAGAGSVLEVRVSTSGLLIRPAAGN